MRIVKTIILLLIVNQAFSQHFQIEEIKAVDGNDFESVFPEVRAISDQDTFSEIAAHRINTYLQYQMLSHVFGKETDNIFKEVFPPEGEYFGQSEFSYNVNMNTEKIFSVTIGYSSTGAYSEYANESFNFSAETGEHLTLDDLFDQENRSKIGTEVARSCASQIRAFLANVDPMDEFIEDYHMIYDGCLEYFEEMNNFPSGDFYFEDDHIVFKAYRCSNHMMAALDELWEYAISFQLEDLRNSFRPEMVKMLFDNGNWKALQNKTPSFKVLHGMVNEKYPITAVLSDLKGDYLYGAYWYDKYKNPITLSGKRSEDGRLLFVEEINGDAIANIELILQKDQLMGVWEKIDRSTSFPIVLRID